MSETGRRAKAEGRSKKVNLLARARRQNPAPVVLLPAVAIATCIGCGCTDDRACDHPVTGPCWWVKVYYILGIGVCSECVEKVEEFENRVLVSRK